MSSDKNTSPLSFANWGDEIEKINKQREDSVALFRQQIFPCPRRVIQRWDNVLTPDNKLAVIHSITKDGSIYLKFSDRAGTAEKYTGKPGDLKVIDSHYDWSNNLTNNYYYAALGKDNLPPKFREACLPPKIALGTPVEFNGTAVVIVAADRESSQYKVKTASGDIITVKESQVREFEDNTFSLKTERENPACCVYAFDTKVASVSPKLAEVHAILQEVDPSGLISFTVKGEDTKKLYTAFAYQLKYAASLFNVTDARLAEERQIKEELGLEAPKEKLLTIREEFEVGDKVLVAYKGQNWQGEIKKIEGKNYTVSTPAEDIVINTLEANILHCKEDYAKAVQDHLAATVTLPIVKEWAKEAAIYQTPAQEYIVAIKGGHKVLSPSFFTKQAAEEFLADLNTSSNVDGRAADTTSEEGTPSETPTPTDVQNNYSIGEQVHLESLGNDIGTSSTSDGEIIAIDPIGGHVTVMTSTGEEITGVPGVDYMVSKAASKDILELLVKDNAIEFAASLVKTAVIKEENGKYYIYSKKGKKLSKGYSSKQEAKKRLNEIEYFKNSKSAQNLTPYEQYLASINFSEDTFDSIWQKKQILAIQHILAADPFTPQQPMPLAEEPDTPEISVVTNGLPVGTVVRIPVIGGDPFLAEVVIPDSTYISEEELSSAFNDDIYYLQVKASKDLGEVDSSMQRLADKYSGLKWGHTKNPMVKFVVREPFDKALQTGDVVIASFPGESLVTDVPALPGAPGLGSPVPPSPGGKGAPFISSLYPVGAITRILEPAIEKTASVKTLNTPDWDLENPWNIVSINVKGKKLLVIKRK